jgi:hypothetical protein
MPKTKPFRQLVEKSNADPARRVLELSQRGISHIETEPNPRLATLDGYVRALGGHLELRAVFEDRTVELALPQSKPKVSR